MEDYAECAGSLFEDGYNCAQAVLAALAKDVGLERDAAVRLASSFGGGMGRLREVCGALTGLFMAAGLRWGYYEPDDQEGKTRHYERIQQLASMFRQEYGSILCRDLIKLDEQISSPTPELRTPEYYQKRPCADYVCFAAALYSRIDQDGSFIPQPGDQEPDRI